MFTGLGLVKDCWHFLYFFDSTACYFSKDLNPLMNVEIDSITFPSFIHLRESLLCGTRWEANRTEKPTRDCRSRQNASLEEPASIWRTRKKKSAGGSLKIPSRADNSLLQLLQSGLTHPHTWGCFSRPQVSSVWQVCDLNMHSFTNKVGYSSYHKGMIPPWVISEVHWLLF